MALIFAVNLLLYFIYNKIKWIVCFITGILVVGSGKKPFSGFEIHKQSGTFLVKISWWTYRTLGRKILAGLFLR